MNTGRISESIQDRSIFKRIRSNNPRVNSGLCVGADGVILDVSKDEKVIIKTHQAIIRNQTDVILAVDKVVNNIACCKGRAQTIAVTVTIPKEASESDLRDVIDNLCSRSMNYGVEISEISTEVTEAVKLPLVTLTAIGTPVEGSHIIKGKAIPGDDIIITKWIGLEGTAIIANIKEKELKEKFSSGFVENALAFTEITDSTKEVMTALEQDVSAIHDIDCGGVFAALWEICKASKVGCKVELMDIPIRQETVEICEVYGINPYELISGGSVIITSANGGRIVDALLEKGINACIVGKITEGNDRIIVNRDETRFLEPYRTDEIYKITNIG